LPIVGATITTNTGAYLNTTAANGSYEITNGAPGAYNVTASKTDYN